jgi:ribosomal protein L7/L12
LGVPPPTCISRSIQPTTTKTNTQQAEKLLEKLKEVGAKVELV